ncbi:histidinol-phosphate transaminase [soil metagenome]
MRAAPLPRPAVAALPAYRPGRSAGMAMVDHGLSSAVKLASNELPLDPLPSVAKALEAAVPSVNRYPDHLATELRAALAERLAVGRDRVAVGCGSVGLLQQLALAFTGPGDEVVYGWPSFEAYPVFTALAGATAVAVPLCAQTLDAEAIVAAVGPRTRLVLLANPNNPTGTALRTGELEAIADALPHGCLLVLDEAYREFVTDTDVPDGLALLGHRPDVAVLRTFSKAHGLAALRIGYLVADPEVVVAVDKVLVPFAVNGLAQAAALASLAAPEELADRVVGVVAERGLVVEALRRTGWWVPDAQANFVWLPAGASAEPLAVGLERAGVVTRGFADLGVRVTIGASAENDRFLEAFATVAARVGAAEQWAAAER